MVRAVVRRRLKDGHDADDAYQAAFLALAKSAAKVKWRGDVAGWLHQTAVQTAKAILRMNAQWEQRKEAARKSEAVCAEQLTAVELEELRTAVDEELRQLPVKLSTPVVLCDMEGLSRAEAARRSGVAFSTLSNRLHRAREELRKRLVRRGFAFSAAAVATYSQIEASASAAAVEETTLFVTKHVSLDLSATTAPRSVAVAEGVLQKMGMLKLIASLSTAALSVAAMLAAFSFNSHAQELTLPIDEFFDDGDFEDGTPARWLTGSQGGDQSEARLEGSDLILSSNDGPFSKYIDGSSALPPDYWAQTTFRVLEPSTANTAVMLIVRSEGQSGYWGAMLPSGELALGESFEDGTSQRQGTLFTNLRPALEDVTLRLDAMSDLIELRAWSAGESMPEESLLSFQDATLPAGAVALVINNIDGGGFMNVAFREFHMAPAPGGAALAGVGALCGVSLVLLRLRRRWDAWSFARLAMPTRESALPAADHATTASQQSIPCS